MRKRLIATVIVATTQLGFLSSSGCKVSTNANGDDSGVPANSADAHQLADSADVNSAQACNATLFDNWNVAVCSAPTSTSTFTLATSSKVDSLVIWVNTSTAGTSLTYTLTGASGIVSTGAMDPGSCDPYQSQWCAMTAHLSKVLGPGSYSVQSSAASTCSNSGSLGSGFVRVLGCPASAAPTDAAVSATDSSAANDANKVTDAARQSDAATRADAACDATLFDNWNVAACTTPTNISKFTLVASSEVDSLVIWVNTSTAGKDLTYTLTGPSGTVSSGTLDPGSCDPYQTQWCALIAHLSKTLGPGTYSLQSSASSTCSNSGSSGNGFVRVMACTASTSPTDAAVIATDSSHSADATAAADAACNGTLFDNWNVAACTAPTRTSTFTLSAQSHIDSLVIWVDTSAAGANLTYTLTGPTGTLSSGALDPGSCDPYQTQWCALTAHPSAVLPAGTYTVQSSAASTCSNSGSSNIGFVRVFGCPG